MLNLVRNPEDMFSSDTAHYDFQIDMAWSSNRFCDFGMALNAPPGQGQQTSARNKGPAPMFNPNSGSNNTQNNNSVSKLETLRAGTAAVSVMVFPILASL